MLLPPGGQNLKGRGVAKRRAEHGECCGLGSQQRLSRNQPCICSVAQGSWAPLKAFPLL